MYRAAWLAAAAAVVVALAGELGEWHQKFEDLAHEVKELRAAAAADGGGAPPAGERTPRRWEELPGPAPLGLVELEANATTALEATWEQGWPVAEAPIAAVVRPACGRRGSAAAARAPGAAWWGAACAAGAAVWLWWLQLGGEVAAKGAATSEHERRTAVVEETSPGRSDAGGTPEEAAQSATPSVDRLRVELEQEKAARRGAEERLASAAAAERAAAAEETAQLRQALQRAEDDAKAMKQALEEAAASARRAGPPRRGDADETNADLHLDLLLAEATGDGAGVVRAACHLLRRGVGAGRLAGLRHLESRKGVSALIDIGAFVAALQDDCDAVRGAVAKVLGAVFHQLGRLWHIQGGQDKALGAVAALASALQDDSEFVRGAAAQALGRGASFGGVGKWVGLEEAVDALASALQDSSQTVCCLAAQALCEIAAGQLPGPTPDKLMHVLASALRGDRAVVRGVVACKLGGIGSKFFHIMVVAWTPKALIDAVGALAADGDERVRQMAALAQKRLLPRPAESGCNQQ